MYKCKATINFRDERKTVTKVGYGSTLYDAIKDSSGIYSIGKEVYSIIFQASKEEDDIKTKE